MTMPVLKLTGINMSLGSIDVSVASPLSALAIPGPVRIGLAGRSKPKLTRPFGSDTAS